MIGFFRKDMYMLLGTYKKNLLLVVGLYTVLTLGMRLSFFLSWIIWMTGFYSLSTINMDEASGWDRYARTLPASCGKIVGARFLAALAMLGIGVAASTVLGALMYGLRRFEDVRELALTIVAVTGLALAMLGLIFPAAYRWGMDKARNGFLMVFALFYVVPWLLRETGLSMRWLHRAGAWLEEADIALLCAGVLAAGLAVFALGGWLSCRIYRKKEF